MNFHAFAPGRVEILGNHTDYNGGVVLSAALDLGVRVEGKPRDGREVIMRSEGIRGCELLTLDDLRKEGRWSDYPAGVIAEMLAADFKVTGFEANFRSDLPEGAGLSSSAAIEVATAILLLEMFQWEMGPMDLARLCRRAENDFVGVQCGLLDQATSVFGRAEHAVFLDCRDESVKQIPFPPGVGLLIVNSGVKHALTGGEYNERRELCHRAARILGIKQLRDADATLLAKAKMHEIVRRRAAHIIGENSRVFEAVACLQTGNLEEFGRLMNLSHQSSIENFENSTTELDVLAEFAREEDGIFGARLTGGGFGGSIVALGKFECLPAAAETIVRRYHNATGHQATTLACRPGDGAWQLFAQPHGEQPD